MDNPAVSYSFGTLGAVCWSIQLLPQIWINWRRHNATGLQPTMMMFWAWAGVPLGVYNIVSNFNVALQIQPQILSVLSLLTWIQCFHYERGWSVLRCLAVVLPIAAMMGAIEVALVFALRIGVQRRVDWPLTLMAVLAALFLALGVLRHYYDIYVHRTVRGISFIFVGLDALGDLTSLVSVLFERHIDVLGVVIYGVELALWIGILAAGGYYNLLPWLKRRLEKRSVAPVHASSDTIGSQDDATANTITLRDLPSSTSVFRTPSSDFELRPRVNAPSASA